MVWGDILASLSDEYPDGGEITKMTLPMWITQMCSVIVMHMFNCH